MRDEGVTHGDTEMVARLTIQRGRAHQCGHVAPRTDNQAVDRRAVERDAVLRVVETQVPAVTEKLVAP